MKIPNKNVKGNRPKNGQNTSILVVGQKMAVSDFDLNFGLFLKVRISFASKDVWTFFKHLLSLFGKLQ